MFTEKNLALLDMSSSISISNYAIVIIIILSSYSHCSQERSVCIIPDELFGIPHPASCDSAVTTNINQLCGNTEDYSNTLITVLKGTHTLNITCDFKEVTNMTFRGTKGSTINCSSNETGLRFLNVSHLEISDIEFTSCGCTSYVVSNLYGLPSKILSALLFINGSSLTLTNLTAVSAGIYIYNVVDYVTMDSCKVINASSEKIDFTSGTVIAYNNHTTTNTRLVISQCHFMNSGYTNYSKGYCSYNNHELVFSCGLALFHGNPNLTVEISDSVFINNTGCNGGNMAVLFFDFRTKYDTSMIAITNTTFTKGCSNYGGGLYVSFENSFSDHRYGYSENRNYNNTKALSIEQSTFSKNFAAMSGGGIYMQWKQSLILNRIVVMNITDSTFESNSIGIKGSGGLALNYKTYIDRDVNGEKIPKFRVNLNIFNCIFHNHFPIASNEEERLLSESSVILARLVPFLGIHDTNITSNNCTAILAIGTTLVFYGSSRISNNTAFIGAGLRLCSGSLMYLTPHMELVITNNSVQQAGGGILVSTDCLDNVPMCFYQYSGEVTSYYSLLSTINVTINNNHSPYGESNIFGGSIDYCYFLYVKESDSRLFMNKLQVPNNTLYNPSSISSRPQHVCFFDVNATDYMCEKVRHISIYPGQNFDIFIRLVGQMNGSVSGIVKASVEGGRVNESERVQTVNISGENLTYTVYPSNHMYPGEEIILILKADVDSDISTNKYVRRFEPASINIKIKVCPFGFTMNTAKMSCQCLVTDFAVEHCNIEIQIISKSTKAWIGMYDIDNQTHFSTSKHCPLDYCDPEVISVHSEPDSLDQDKQCRYNRTGVLCGSCPENSSLVLGSSECRDNCSNVYLLLILPFAVAGFLLVLIIHFLNLTVTMGTVCGLIFYANIVQDYSIGLLSEYPIPVLTPILQVFLAWLNLDLGIQTCFYDGMEAFGKTMFLYVFPIYIWLISAIIIYLSNRYIRVTRFVGENAVKVLATLFLLSYSKMLRVTLGTLNLSVINIHINSTCTISKLRWILDGNVAYFDDGKHFSLFIISLFFIVFTLPFAFSLLCLKFVYSLSNCCRVFSWIDKLKPFFDTYTGPYKDKARFWTGLLLLVRISLLVIHAFDYSNSHIPHLFVITASLLLISNMVILNGVYKNHYLNILEYFYIFNLGILFSTILSNIGLKWQSIVSHVLVSSAFLAFLGIVGYHVYLFCKRWGRIPAFWRRNSEFDVMSCEGMRGYEQLENENTNLMAVTG